MGPLSDAWPTLAELSQWCRHQLGSPVDRLLFTAGFRTQVSGLVLVDGRQVVTKVSGWTPRLRAAILVQRHVWAAGFPCPQPLVGPLALGHHWIWAESLVAGGLPLTDDPRAPELYAQALAELVRRAPPAASVPLLVPPPAWLHWDHAEAGLWPRREHVGNENLNDRSDPPWLSEAAHRVRSRLAGFEGPVVVGHGDWWSDNLRWIGEQLHVVFDWDSLTARPEPGLAGAAAYMFAKTSFELDGCAPGASVECTEQFLDAYEQARGRRWSVAERQAAWAAGLWVAVFDARLSRCEDRGQGFADLVRRDASERLRRAGG